MNPNDNVINHIFILEDEKSKQTIYLDKPIYSLGRHSSSSIQLNSQEVSRHHATLVRKNTANNNYSYLLVDGDLKGKRSQNGIFVNGKKKLAHELKHGDVILFGSEAIKAIYQIQVIAKKKKNEPIKSIYQIEESPEKNAFNLSNRSREELQKTLILSEKNLPIKLQNADLNRLASFPELSPNPIIELDWLGNVTYLNPAANLRFKNIQELKLEHPLLADIVLKPQDQHGRLVIREVQINNQYFEQYIHYLSETHLIRSYIFDITDRKKSEDKLRYQALHDSITDLGNRNFLYQELEKYLVKAKKKNQQVAVLFIDLDRFKNINDTLSHSIGDKLLQKLASRLVSKLPSDYILTRWGGDEFVLVVPDLKKRNHAEQIAQRILDSLKEPFFLGDTRIYISTSIGISIYPQDGEDQETLIKNADAALYRAKEQGKNNFQFYSYFLQRDKSILFKIENTLYHALENKEFFLKYQPQMNVSAGSIHGFEALIRWQHPELGNILPGKFIPLAEETGLIIPIGEWVLETACRQNKAWQNAGLPNIPIAVNLSVRQFQQKNLAERVAEILQKTQLEAKFLELEITESILIQDIELAQKVLGDLLDLGISISLDDFGTGYSSLGYLKRFSFNTIKIDRSFVTDLVKNSQDIALISAVIALGKGLRMKVIAEGVETKEQLELLKNLNCEIIQGILFSHPLTSEEVPSFLITHKIESH
jgi:diguanylate cyclase (GGDEF)-like protein